MCYQNVMRTSVLCASNAAKVSKISRKLIYMGRQELTQETPASISVASSSIG